MLILFSQFNKYNVKESLAFFHYSYFSFINAVFESSENDALFLLVPFYFDFISALRLGGISCLKLFLRDAQWQLLWECRRRDSGPSLAFIRQTWRVRWSVSGTTLGLRTPSWNLSGGDEVWQAEPSTVSNVKTCVNVILMKIEKNFVNNQTSYWRDWLWFRDNRREKYFSYNVLLLSSVKKNQQLIFKRGRPSSFATFMIHIWCVISSCCN